MAYNKNHDTAARVAFVRAWDYHQPPETRICNDSVAARLLKKPFHLFAITRLGRWIFWNKIEPWQKASFGYIPLRSRVIDDYLQECIDAGLEQLVIMGAGFDSRAYRFDELKEKVRVFEIDRPSNREIKLSRVRKAFGSVPEHVTYVPIDFEKDDLYETLKENGYELDLKTLFIWEGVTPYLNPDAVDQTLAFVSGKSKPGSSIIFDYMLDDVVKGTSRDPLAKKMIDFGLEVGEPYKFGMNPESIGEFLSERGFSNITNYTVDQCREKFHKPIHKDIDVMSFFNIVHAHV